MNYKYFLNFLLIITLISCGGGGGGSSDPQQPSLFNPVINTFASSLSAIVLGNSVDLSWTTFNAISCSGSGDWTGAKATGSGSETLTLSDIKSYTFTLTCRGENPQNTVTKSVTVRVTESSSSSNCKTPKNDSTSYWLEDFNNSYLDSNIFSYQIGNGSFAQGIEGWGNNEAQYYTGPGSGTYGNYSNSYDSQTNTTENVFIEDGYLKIQPTYHDTDLFNDPNYGNRSFTFTSGKLVTSSKKIFEQPSRITVCFKVPDGAGFWPAIWFLPQGFIEFNKSWPDDGEIDLMEARGRLPQVVSSAMHFRANWGNGHYLTSDAYVPMVENFQDTFHSITFEWQENSIKMYLDNDETPFFQETSESNALVGTHYPFNEPFYLILNVAIGGHYGGQNQWQNIGGVNAQYPPDNSVFCHNNQCSNLSEPDRGRFLIDYIELKSID